VPAAQQLHIQGGKNSITTEKQSIRAGRAMKVVEYKVGTPKVIPWSDVQLVYVPLIKMYLLSKKQVQNIQQ